MSKRDWTPLGDARIEELANAVWIGSRNVSPSEVKSMALEVLRARNALAAVGNPEGLPDLLAKAKEWLANDDLQDAWDALQIDEEKLP